MTLQTTGPISLFDVNVELDLSGTALVSLNDAVVRSLLNVASGTISLYDAYGKSSAILMLPWELTVVSVANLSVFDVRPNDTTATGIHFSPDGTKMYVAGDAGNDINEYTLSTAWDITTASYVQAGYIGSQESTPEGVFFKPDGTKMYVTGNAGDDVNEYTLSTAWNVSTASYVQSFSVATQETAPTSLFFKPDGTKMYVIGYVGDDVNEYTLSTAWNVSTASYVQSFSVAAQETSPQGIFFKPDGTKMYVIGTTGDDVNEYTLSTAWNVSTASYLQNFSVAAQDTYPTGISFKSDGTKMYVLGQNENLVFEYDLSTAWDISTASFYNPQSYIGVYGRETAPQSIFFKPDGTKMYVIGYVGDDVNEYDLSTAWDITTASYVQVKSISAQENTAYGLFFSPSGTKMYVTGASDEVNEYTLSTAWNVSTASYVQVKSTTGELYNPTGIFFKPDGLNMYITGAGEGAVFKYSLSTAWDISTATIPSYGKIPILSLSALTGLFFKSDGTKMYVLDATSDAVNEYTLSTAWDITTASWVYKFYVSSQENAPTSLFFKPDGTKMYVIGTTGDDVNEYDLSTAWDVSTASYLQVKSIQAEDYVPVGLFFKSDGTKMYVLGDTGNDVNEYTLSTAWNVSTASYVQRFVVSSQASYPVNLSFNSDGTKMYVIGHNGQSYTIHEYGLSTAWNVSTASYLGGFAPKEHRYPKDLSFNSDGTKMYLIGAGGSPEFSGAVYSYTLSTAWDITTAVWDAPANSYFYTGNQDTLPEDVFFKDDGTKMYIIGYWGGDVNEYDLSTAWDVSTASYVQNYVFDNVAAYSNRPKGMFIKPDGSQMYIIDWYGSVRKYDLGYYA